ncbi:hypothetical protein SADUNF_Sadunf10G0066800 [Salix dunnii]|uniref:Uncharacterized protein n=1 Tax=Salix dunnii TaxID=1413687 RepID=A0A835MUE6_9ROSI|nr:hypothetical protein SADUNF_Sadunf10G0066800 [Salix dunnii]
MGKHSYDRIHTWLYSVAPGLVRRLDDLRRFAPDTHFTSSAKYSSNRACGSPGEAPKQWVKKLLTGAFGPEE